MVDSTSPTEYFWFVLHWFHKELLDLKAADKNKHRSLKHPDGDSETIWMEVRILRPFLHSIYKPSQVKEKNKTPTFMQGGTYVVIWTGSQEKNHCESTKRKSETKLP